MEAIVIGGGIGGPITAMALERVGIRAVVYEAHDGPADSLGLFLGLGVNGMRVLRHLDLLDPVMRADIVPTSDMVFSSWTGKRLGVVSNGWLDPKTPSITLMRGVLQRVLAEEANARGIRIHYGKRFTDYAEQDGRVVARFDDGSETEGDILIGADGIRSRVRAAMTPGGVEPSFTGLINLGGVVPDSRMPATTGAMHMVWGRRAFFGYTVRPGGEAWWFANVGSDQEPDRRELAAVPSEQWKQRLRNLFLDDPDFIMELIDATQEIGAHPIHDMPSLRRWYRDGAVLMGDAAHAVSPSAGQGASMAMEDALVLAQCLRGAAAPRCAFTRYEELRRPRTERIVATGRRRGTYKAPKSRVAVTLRDLLMPLVFRLFVTEKSMSWIHDYQVPWEESKTGEAA